MNNNYCYHTIVRISALINRLWRADITYNGPILLALLKIPRADIAASMVA